MILNNRKSGSIRRTQALCFHGAALVLAIICYIFIFFISDSINEAASIAIDQYHVGTLKICFQIFKLLHLVASCLFLVLVFTTFYEHWHSGIFFCVSNLLLYLPSEAFVFKYVDAFNFNSTHWVILRWIHTFFCGVILKSPFFFPP